MRFFRPLLFVYTFSFFAFSTSQSLGQFSAAFSGGINVSSLHGSIDASPIVRVNVGIWGKYDLQENVTAHIGLVYSGTGATFNYQKVESKFKGSNLQIPVYFGYKVMDQDPVKLSILGGGYVGLLLGASMDGGGGSNVTLGTDFGELDFGLSAGVHADLIEGFAVMATYNYGLMHPATVYTGGGFNYNTEEFSNRFVQLSLIYTFYKL